MMQKWKDFMALGKIKQKEEKNTPNEMKFIFCDTEGKQENMDGWKMKIFMNIKCNFHSLGCLSLGRCLNESRKWLKLRYRKSFRGRNINFIEENCHCRGEKFLKFIFLC